MGLVEHLWSIVHAHCLPDQRWLLSADDLVKLISLAPFRRWCLIAFDIIVGYSGMFRVMELLSLTAKSLTGMLVDASVTLMLRATKTSSRKQTTDMVTIADPRAATALILSPKRLRAALRTLSTSLDLQVLLITRHSFRQGRATQRFRETGSFHVVAEVSVGFAHDLPQVCGSCNS